MYAVPLPSRSQASSESWGTSTDPGDIWRPEGVDGANYIHVHRGSASPNIEASHDQRRRVGSVASRETSVFQSPYVPNSMAYSWSLDGECLKSGPSGHGLLAPQDRMSPSSRSAGYSSIATNGTYDVGSIASSGVVPEDGLLREPYVPTSHRALSQSPLSASVTLNDQCASVSPTPKKPSRSPPKKPSNPTNPKRHKVRRKTHNAIEQRYRIRLNDKIAELRESIPALRMNPTLGFGSTQGEMELGIGAEGGTVHKVNKASVLEKATEYIKSLELSNQRLQAELHRVLSLPRNNPANRPMPPLPYQFSVESSVGSPHLTLNGNQAFEACRYLDRES